MICNIYAVVSASSHKLVSLTCQSDDREVSHTNLKTLQVELCSDDSDGAKQTMILPPRKLINNLTHSTSKRLPYWVSHV